MCDDGTALFVQVKVSAEKWHCWWCVGEKRGVGSAEISFARRRLRVVVCASLSSFPCAANLPVDNWRRVVHTASGGGRRSMAVTSLSAGLSLHLVLSRRPLSRRIVCNLLSRRLSASFLRIPRTLRPETAYDEGGDEILFLPSQKVPRGFTRITPTEVGKPNKHRDLLLSQLSNSGSEIGDPPSNAAKGGRRPKKRGTDRPRRDKNDSDDPPAPRPRRNKRKDLSLRKKPPSENDAGNASEKMHIDTSTDAQHSVAESSENSPDSANAGIHSGESASTDDKSNETSEEPAAGDQEARPVSDAPGQDEGQGLGDAVMADATDEGEFVWSLDQIQICRGPSMP